MKCFTAIIITSLMALATARPAASCNGAATAVTTTASTNGTATAGTSNNGTASAGSSTGSNVQVFTGSLGGAPPAVIQSSGSRPFSVNGDTFVGVKAALGRSCDVQHNACAQAANSGSIDATVGDCDQQNTECHSANGI